VHLFPLAAHEVTAMTNYSATCTATWFHYWRIRWNSTSKLCLQIRSFSNFYCYLLKIQTLLQVLVGE